MNPEIIIPVLLGVIFIVWLRKRIKDADPIPSVLFKRMMLLKLGCDEKSDAEKIKTLLALPDGDFFAYVREEFNRKENLFRSRILHFIRSSTATPPGKPAAEREQMIAAAERLLDDPKTTFHLKIYPNELPVLLLLRDAKIQTGKNQEIGDCREAVSLHLHLPPELEEKIKSFARLQEDLNRLPPKTP